MIRLTRPWLGDPEIDAVASVLGSGMLVQGAHVERFESEVRRRCGRRFAVAVASGTTALTLSLEACGIGPGDEVLVPALTWPSPAHAVRLLGATPVLVDVHPREWNATRETFASARTARTRAAVVIDQFGSPVRKQGLTETLSGLAVIEDAACALGSTFEDGPCGSLGRVSCLSFHPRKIITTGEGGMCLTDDEALFDALRALRNHGQRAAGEFVRAGGNARLTELGAAMGCAQLARLDEVIRRRHRHMERYRSALPMLAFQEAPPGCTSNYQTAGALLPLPCSARERDALLSRLLERGVEAGRLSYALHRVPSLAPPSNSHVPAPLVHTESIADRGLALPLYAELTDVDQGAVIDAVRTSFREVCS